MYVEQLVEVEKQFDVVISSEVIEHVVDPYHFLSSLTALVKVRYNTSLGS